jgi:hypothetical protein
LVEVSDLVVAEAVEMVLVKPALIGDLEELLREDLGEVDLRTEVAAGTDHGAWEVGMPGMADAAMSE